MTFLDTLLGRNRALIPAPPSGVVVVEEQKAVTGAWVTAVTLGYQQISFGNTAQKRAWAAAMLYADHPSVHKAESAVSGRAAKVRWHLEDANDDTVEQGPLVDLLRNPQRALPPEQRQPGITQRGLWEITLRHMGLCGSSFWYLDQTLGLEGPPASILYVAPWRLYPVLSETGGLRGWTLDKPSEEGGTPLDRANVLPFYLQPPDAGYFASGLVQAAHTKIGLGPLLDQHIAKVIGAGGRLTGLLSPKASTVVSDDQWAAFVNDYRNIAGDPSAAQRLQIVKGPVDYVRMAATMDELQVVDIDDAVDDDILELWGVPRSQTGKKAEAGLNSGGTKGYDEAIIWQGPIDDRLTTFRETVQDGLVDRFGQDTTLVLDTPKFDDDSPQWAKAAQADPVPMTADERRAIVNLPPLEGENAPFGALLTWQGRVVDPANPNPPPPPNPFLAAETPPLEVPAEEEAKALSRFAPLRRSVDANAVPRLKSAVLAVLAEQKASVLRHLRRVGIEGLRKKPNDLFLRAEQMDKALAGAMRPILEGVSSRVSRTVARKLPAKADDFTDKVVTAVLTRGGSRVTNISATTLTSLREAVTAALVDAETVDDVIDAVAGLDIFGELRAETIARTESMFAYNQAALESYGEMGVTEVEAIDGDEDEECAERDGQVFSIEEAMSIEDHPNGTLDFSPIVPDEEPAAKATRTELEYDALGRVFAIVERVA